MIDPKIAKGFKHLYLHKDEVDVRRILFSNATFLKKISADISAFRAYKRFHGILHDLQLRTSQPGFEFPNNSEGDVKKFLSTNLFITFTDIEHCYHQLRRVVASEDEGVVRVYPAIQANLKRISDFRDSFEAAIKKRDNGAAMRFLKPLKRTVLETQISLNAGLIGTASLLELDKLAFVAQQVAFAKPVADREPYQDIEKGLQDAFKYLKNLIALHEVWQSIENEMIRVADSIELLVRAAENPQKGDLAAREQLADEWPGIRNQLLDISRIDKTGTWGTGLELALSDADDALAVEVPSNEELRAQAATDEEFERKISQRPEEEARIARAVKQRFETCQKLVRKLFYAHDETIIRLCDELGDLHPFISHIILPGD